MAATVCGDELRRRIEEIGGKEIVLESGHQKWLCNLWTTLFAVFSFSLYFVELRISRMSIYRESVGGGGERGNANKSRFYLFIRKWRIFVNIRIVSFIISECDISTVLVKTC